jgi:enediyne biosynthesis protein E3
MTNWPRRLIFGTPIRLAMLVHRADRGGAEEVRRALDGAQRCFLDAYTMALDGDDADRLALRLARLPDVVRGFAYEGAGAALTVLDRFRPASRPRFDALLRGPGEGFAVLLHVGAGLALARLSRHIEDETRDRDPEMRYFPLDGYGFERGVFGSARVVAGGEVPPLSAYGRRAFDHGLGRGLWFREATDLGRIARTIAGLAPARHADVWSGVGLAIAYAGPNTEATLVALAEAAGPHRGSVQLGTACAAFLRGQGHNPSPYTERAASVLCGMPADRVAEGARQTMEALRETAGRPDVAENPYEAFRVALQAFVSAPAPAPEPPRQSLSAGV